MLQRCRLQSRDLVEVGAIKQLRLARAIEDVREVCSLLFAQMDPRFVALDQEKFRLVGMKL